MPDDNPLRWATFIVRLLLEEGVTGWRGEVIHVQSRAVLHFTSLAQCEAFIQGLAPGVAPDATSVSGPIDPG